MKKIVFHHQVMKVGTIPVAFCLLTSQEERELDLFLTSIMGTAVTVESS